MSKHTKNYDKAKSAVDQTVKEWGQTTLSDIEKYMREWWLIHGMCRAFLRFLSFDEYNDIKEYIWQQYGLNVGGTSGDFTKKETKEETDDQTDNSDPGI